MTQTFQLSCESTVDMPYSYVAERNISVLFYSYTINGEELVDDMGRDPQALPQFYQKLEQGALPSTSQINTYRYLEYFDTLLQKGDVLHLAFGSGMTPSVNNAWEAAEQLRKKYPARKLIVIDTTCSSSGYGLFVDYAADLRDDGKSMEEIETWALENCHNVHHQFFSTDLKYFRRSGRVSGATAMVASVLGICPIMHLNYDGRIIAYSKVRGKKAAIRETIRVMAEHAQNRTEYTGKCFISHANCRADAEEMRDEIRKLFPKMKSEIRIFDIGTIIASHTGPGTVALYFFGDERTKQ